MNQYSILIMLRALYPNHHMTKALKEMALAIYPDEYKSLENE